MSKASHSSHTQSSPPRSADKIRTRLGSAIALETATSLFMWRTYRIFPIYIASEPPLQGASSARKDRCNRDLCCVLTQSGTNCFRLGGKSGVATVLIFSRNGRIVSTQQGPANETALKTAFAAIDSALNIASDPSNRESGAPAVSK